MSDRQATVIVTGSLNVDLIVGVPDLPTAGETVLGERFVQQNGGKGANQAVAAARVGADVTMLGAVGADDLGRAALGGLAEAGVDASACRVLEGTHTGLALIVVDKAGENQIAVASGANALLDGAMIEQATSGLEVEAGAVCLLGFEVRDEAIVAAARWAHARGMPIVLNPPPARALPAAIVELGPILTPNESEALMLAGEGDLEAAARSLEARTGAPVIVTLGADGALLQQRSGSERLPAFPVEPVDTTGAGDALNGILAAELSRGASLREALRWAMAGAAIKTTKPGAQAGLPTRDEISRRLT